jgi:CubicO group peptidase (beta-lactamase class C family)
MHGSRIRSRHFLLATALLLGVAARLQAQAPVATASDSAAIAQARAVVRARLDSIPGIAVAVARNGRIVWSEGFGWADLEQRVPVTPATEFRVGSISKSLTSAAVGLLVEAGTLDLDAAVQRYVPSFPVKRWPITTRQVAGHLAGIRHYRGDEFLLNRHYGSVLESLDIFEDDSLLFQPGTRFSYSSYGWNLVSAVIEAASGTSYLEFMRTRVFEPLHLVHTRPEFMDSIIPHRTRYYDRRGGQWLNSPRVDNSYKWAGGGFLSTAEDLVTYGSALLRPGFLRAETLRLLFTSQRTAAGEETGYGVGWFIGKSARGGPAYFHGGGSVGGTSQLLVFPQEGLVLAIVTNMTGASLRGLTDGLESVFVGN